MKAAVALLLLVMAFALLFLASHAVATAREDAVAATARAERAEKLLTHCLNGGWFNSSAGVLNCGRAL
jgi:hypothetical protein